MKQLRLFLALVLVGALLVSPISALGGPAKDVDAERRGSPDALVDSPSDSSGEWVVGLSAPLDARGRRVFKGVGARVRKVSADGRHVLVEEAREGLDIRTLKRAKGVRYVEPSVRFRAHRVPSDPAYPQQWGLPAVGAPAAWEVSRGSADVVIAVIDTGVDLANPEFAGRLTAGRDFVNGDTGAQDDEGHGTHVASIAAAAADNGLGGSGVAPATRIMPVKVLDADGGGTSFDVAQGIRWAADSGAKVINLSLGSRDFAQVVAEAVAYALSKDVVVVAAAGNSATAVEYPARLPGVLAVSAVDRQLALASFSNRGPEIDIAAPGVDILATLPGGRMEAWPGTSMAAPFVAGAAALVRAVSPDLTQSQVAARLTATARDIGPAGKDSSFGSGLLDVGRALERSNAGDDDVPGRALPASPVYDTLAAGSDTYDVYRVTLQAGQRLVASLSGPVGSDFRLDLLGSDTAHVGAAARPVAVGTVTGYPRRLAHVSATTSVYYLVATAASGSGSYTLTYTIDAAATGDDEVPGVDLPPSPVRDTLSDTSDTDDVFRVTLVPGDRLMVSLTGDSGTDFDLYLFGPGVPTVDGTYDPVAQSSGQSYPERIDHVATRAGTYYLNPYAYRGSGAYTLTWTILKSSGEFDDDIPGRPLPPSPVTGTVSAVGDPDDVFSVDLSAGDELTLQLAGAPGTDFDLYIFGPGNTTVDGSEPSLAHAVGQSYPERLTYVATTAGRYYVDVYAYAGSGGYTLTYELTNASADDQIPGVVVPPSPIRGNLDEVFDYDDVYAVRLAAGQQLTARLDSGADTDYDLYLFAPGATDVGSDDPVAVSYGTEYPERVTYIASEPGTYYVDVYAYAGTGPYDVTYSVGPATAARTRLELTADKPVGATDVSLTATLTSGGAPLAGAPVTFEGFVDNSWRTVGFRRTDAAGVASAVSSLRGARRFRVHFSGDETHASSFSSPAEAPLRAAAGVSLVARPSAPAYGSRTTLVAEAKDPYSGTPIAGPVRIERRSGDAWVAVGGAQVVGGRATASVVLRGATSYRAVFGGTETHDPSVSDAVVVKPRVVLSAPSSPSSMRRGRAFVVSGALSPRHGALSRVQVKAYRLEGARWIVRRTVAARLVSSGRGSRYTASLSLPSAGRWRLRAYHPANASFAETYGAWGPQVRVY